MAFLFLNIRINKTLKCKPEHLSWESTHQYHQHYTKGYLTNITNIPVLYLLS